MHYIRSPQAKAAKFSVWWWYTPAVSGNKHPCIPGMKGHGKRGTMFLCVPCGFRRHTDRASGHLRPEIDVQQTACSFL